MAQQKRSRAHKHSHKSDVGQDHAVEQKARLRIVMQEYAPRIAIFIDEQGMTNPVQTRCCFEKARRSEQAQQQIPLYVMLQGGRSLQNSIEQSPRTLEKIPQRYQIEIAHLSWPGAVFFAIAVTTPGIHVRAGKRPNSKANGAACGLGRCLAHGGIRPEQSWVWARFRCVAMAEVPKVKISYACSPQLPEAIICCASHRPAILVCGISLFARE